MSNIDRIVLETWEDGFVIVGDEAWLPEDYATHCYECANCGQRFMLWPDPKGRFTGRPPSLCSDECRRLSKNRIEAARIRRVRHQQKESAA